MPRFTHKIRATIGLPLLLIACSASATPKPLPSISPLPVTIYAPTSAPVMRATATVAPTAVPSMPVVDVAQTSIHHDLLFIQDDRLMRWKSASNKTEVVLGDGPVWDYVLTADQKHAAVVLQWQGKDVLGMFHLESKTLDVLVPITRVWPTQWVPWDRHWFKPSPDGRWVAYVQPKGPKVAVELLVHPTTSNGQAKAVQVAQCGVSSEFPEDGPNCADFIWSPNSETLLWSDWAGLWSTHISSVPTLLRTAEVPMPSATRNGFVKRFLEWSPNHQFLLIEIGFYEGSSQAVLDPVTGQLFAVPDTFAYSQTRGKSLWRNDSSVLALSNSSSITATSLKLRQDSVITSTETVDLRPSHEITYSVAVRPANIESIAFSDADQVNAIVSTETDVESHWPRYLYRLNATQVNAKLPVALPAELAGYLFLNATWSPDGQTALIFNELGVGLYLISATDEAAVKLSTMLKGKEPPHRFEWLR